MLGREKTFIHNQAQRMYKDRL